MRLPTAEEIKTKNINVVLIFYAGYNEILNKNLIKFKKEFPKVILINELGDEPQTRNLNYIRAAVSDISLSPDYECYKYWRKRILTAFGLPIGQIVKFSTLKIKGKEIFL